MDYTFAAVGVKDSEVDISSNCGTMTSAIGPFAVDSGLVECEKNDRNKTVRIRNTNTGKLIDASFPIEDGEAVVRGEFEIDGVAGQFTKIRLAFLDPAYVTFDVVFGNPRGSRQLTCLSVQRLKDWKVSPYRERRGYLRWRGSYLCRRRKSLRLPASF